MLEPTEKDLKRFWSKVLIKQPDECWLWTGGRFNHGYGRFYLKNKAIGAHTFRMN